MDKTKRTVIVSDGLWRKSLSAIRSLGKANFKVIVLGDSFFTTGFWSRYTSAFKIIPSVKTNSTKFNNLLVNLLKSLPFPSRPILFPMEDDTLNWLSINREFYSKYMDFAIPPHKSLLVAQDKFKTMRLASSLKIPTPKTFSFRGVKTFKSKLEEITSSGQLKKYIIKPKSGTGSAGIVYLNSQLNINWDEHWNSYGSLLIQEKIPTDGRAVGVSFLIANGKRVIASFVHERIKQYPNSGGPSTQRISIKHKELVARSEKLLTALNWHGVAMVEWKQDLNNGEFKLMEINPRFWGSLELAVRSGVNFPLLYAKCSIGESINEVQNYSYGTKCRWLIPGDILRYLTSKKEDREKLKDFLSGLPKDSEEWDMKDIRGTISSIICPAFLAMNYKYWKYLFRK
jgi:predicted ATP-grasp superfamily ATP-dependent carboligase